MIDLDDADLARRIDELPAYTRELFERATAHALRLHADQVTPEHLLFVLMEDDDSAAHRVVLHAFADPPTIAEEALALSEGILGVGSERSLPFSVRGVRALEAARRRAAEERAATVAPAHLLEAAVDALGDELAGALEAAGWRAGPVPLVPPVSEGVPAEGPLFHHFDDGARRALGLACRLACRSGRAAIAPAHVALACADLDRGLAEARGPGAVGLRRLLAGRDEDPEAAAPRSLGASGELARLVGALADDAGSTAILGWLLERGTSELRELLRRNRITAELLRRAGDAFRDPGAGAGPARS